MTSGVQQFVFQLAIIYAASLTHSCPAMVNTAIGGVVKHMQGLEVPGLSGRARLRFHLFRFLKCSVTNGVRYGSLVQYQPSTEQQQTFAQPRIFLNRRKAGLFRLTFSVRINPEYILQMLIVLLSIDHRLHSDHVGSKCIQIMLLYDVGTFRFAILYMSNERRTHACLPQLQPL